MKINLFNYTITIKKKIKKQVKKTKGKFGLDIPVAPEGFRHRWIRAGNIDRKHIAMRSGIQLVKAKDYKQSFATVEKGIFKGCIGIGGLILTRIPEKFFK